MSGLEERANQYIDHSTRTPKTGDIYENEDCLVYFLNSEELLKIDGDPWTTWSEKAKSLFKVTFLSLCEAGIEILDENTCPMPRSEFQTMAFNAAMIAAEALTHIEVDTPSPKLCECPQGLRHRRWPWYFLSIQNEWV